MTDKEIVALETYRSIRKAWQMSPFYLKMEHVPDMMGSMDRNECGNRCVVDLERYSDKYKRKRTDAVPLGNYVTSTL